MKLCRVLLCLCLMATVSGVYGNTLLDNAQKHPYTITLDWKTYFLPDDERIVLYGTKRRHFLTSRWYWGESGYGAVSGKRSGYLEGGVISGYLAPLSPTWMVDARVFVGAGGGGSAPQGGGMIINPTLGVMRQLQHGLYVGAELGHIKFLNGDIESTTVGMGLTMYFWELLIPKEAL